MRSKEDLQYKFMTNAIEPIAFIAPTQCKLLPFHDAELTDMIGGVRLIPTRHPRPPLI